MGTLSGHVEFPGLAGSGSLETTAMAGAVALGALTGSGTLTTGAMGTGRAVLRPLTGSGALHSGYVLSGSAVLRPLTGSGTLHSGHVLSGSATLPALAGSGWIIPNNQVTLPGLSGAGQLHNGRVLSGAVKLPALLGTGWGAGEYVLSGAVKLPALLGEGPLHRGTYLSGSAALPALAVSGWARTGRVASGAVVLPALLGAGVLAPGHLLSGAAKLPALGSRGSLLNDLVEAFTAWLLNTEGGGVSNYTNYDFHSLVELNGAYYGMSDEGIFLLEGDDDDGSAIGATLTFGVTDLDAEQVTRLGTVVVDLRAGGDLQLHVTIDGEDDVHSYQVSPSQAGLHPVPVPTGRQLESLHWQFSLTNVQGADFDINALTFKPHGVNRRS